MDLDVIDLNHLANVKSSETQPKAAIPEKVQSKGDTSNKKLVFKPVKLNNMRQAKGLIDSGAEADAINAQFLTTIKAALMPLDKPILVGGAMKNANGVTAHYYTELDIQVENISEKRKFLVVEHLKHPIILGLPFVRTYGFDRFMNEEELDDATAKEQKEVDISETSTQQEQETVCAGLELVEDFSTIEKEDMTDADIGLFFVKGEEQDTSTDLPEFILTDYNDVVKDSLPAGLPPERSIKHQINLVPDSKPPYRLPYKLSYTEKQEVERQIEELLATGKIVPSASPFGAPVFLVKKKDGTKRMVIDYRMLNSITVKNRFPLPVINQLLDNLNGAKIYSSLDLLSGFHQLAVEEKDVDKTSFITHAGQYSFRVLPFGLCNAPSSYQMLLQTVLQGLLNKICLVYIDDIIIYSQNEQEHEHHLRLVLNRLREHHLIAKAKKCQFFKRTIKFLGHTISEKGIAVDEDKVKTIKEWKHINTPKQAQSFLGLANYYRRFIQNFSHIARPIHNYIKGEINWNPSCDEAISTLKDRLITAPILKFPDFSKGFVLFTDASDFAGGAVLHQVDEQQKLLGVIAFESFKWLPAETRYDTREKEILSIIKALKTFRHYLMGIHFIIYTDHKSLTYLTTLKNPSGRILRWLDFLADYDFDIRYVEGTKNRVADALSRKDLDTIEIANTVTLTLNPEYYEMLKQGYQNDSEFSTIYAVLKGDIDCPKSLKTLINRYHLKDDLLFYSLHLESERLCVPSTTHLRNEIISQAHNGHNGAFKMFEMLSRSYYWKSMLRTTKRFVNKCDVCQKSKQSTVSKPGLSKPLPIPRARWSDISIDFITGLPKTDPFNYDTIITVVDRFTKRAHFIPTYSKVTVLDLVEIIFNEVIKHHGVPESITSDRDIKFINGVWERIRERLGIVQNLTTSSNPQSDGQAERTNKTIEQLLRSYVNEFQTNWDYFLSTAEFSYNSSYHSAINSSPFYADLGYHPRFINYFHFHGPPQNASEMHTDDFIHHQSQVLQITKDYLSQYQDSFSIRMNQNQRDLVLKEGEMVLLHRDAYLQQAAEQKLKLQYYGPFRITKKINDNAYELEMPSTFKRHPVFNIKMLKPYHEKTNDYFKIPPEDRNEIDNNVHKITSIVGINNDHTVAECTWKECDITDTVMVPFKVLKKLGRDKLFHLAERYNKTIGRYSS